MTTTLEFVLSAIDKASNVFTEVGESSTKSSSGISKAWGAVGGTIASIGVGTMIWDQSQEAIEASSDLAETINKSTVIFGENAAAVESWADSADTSFGLSKQAALESASSFGNMFTQLGFAGDQATGMSEQVVKLAADLGSFNNMPTDEVLEKIAGGFRGEYDSLQQLLPNIDSARVAQEALNETHKTSAADLTAAEKATATLALIQKDGAASADDFAETSSGLANSTKINAAEQENLKAKLGEDLLPVMNGVLHAGMALTEWASEHTTATKVIIGAVGLMAVTYGALSAAETVSAGISALRGTALATETAATATATAANVPFAVSLWAATWPILAIVAAIALVVLGVYELVTHWDTVKTAIGTGAEWIKDKFVEGFNWLTDNWPLVLGILTGPIGLASAWVIDNWDQVSTFFTELPGKMWDGLTGVFDLLVNGDYTGKLASSLGLDEDSPIIGGILDLRDKVLDFFDGVGEGFVRPFKQGFHDVAVLWNSTLGSFDWQMPWWMGGFHITIPQVAVPALAAGGIVTAPTLALIGEAGPEAVVPLSGASRYGVGVGGGDRTIVVPVMIDGREVARAVARADAESL